MENSTFLQYTVSELIIAPKSGVRTLFNINVDFSRRGQHERYPTKKNLKFKLSTSLLLISCIALSISLYLERLGNDRRTERLVDGGMYWLDSMRLENLQTDDPGQLANRIETDQVRQVITIFRRVSLIQEF